MSRIYRVTGYGDPIECLTLEAAQAEVRARRWSYAAIALTERNMQIYDQRRRHVGTVVETIITDPDDDP